MKYIFNWPSGTGGDFLLSLVMQNKHPEETWSEAHAMTNLWQVHNEHRITRAVKYGYEGKEDHKRILDSMPDGHTLQSHVFNTELLDNDNIKCIHIYSDDIFIRSWLKIVHRCKTNNEEPDCLIDNWMPPIKKQNVLNIEYKDLIDNTHDTIQRLFDWYDIPDYDLDFNSNLFKLYHEKNLTMSQSFILTNKIYRNPSVPANRRFMIPLKDLVHINEFLNFDWNGKAKTSPYQMVSDWKAEISKLA